MQGLDVLREAAAAVPDAREEEARSNARVGAHAAPHLVHVRADQLAKVGHLVHKGNFSCEERIGRVLGEFRTFFIHENDGVALAHKRLVKLFHQLLGPGAGAADDHPVGLHEVVNREAFPQEFGIRNDVEVHVGVCGHSCVHLFRGTNRHGAFVDDDLVVFDHLAEFVGDSKNVAQIGRTIFARRRGERQENQGSVGHGFRERGREGKAARLDVALEQNVEVRFVNRDVARLHGGDFLFVDVDADHLIARLRETCPRDEAHVSGSYYRYLHCFFIGL